MDVLSIDLKLISLKEISKDEFLNLKDLKSIGKELIRALEKTGFVYLTSHGIPNELLERSFRSSLNFFNLEEVKKDEFAIDSKRFHGYVGNSKELVSDAKTKEIREAFNINTMDKTILPPNDIANDFSNSLTLLGSMMEQLSRRLFMVLASALEMDHMKLLEMFKFPFSSQNFTTLRTLFYPVVSEENQSQTRLAEHTDFGPLTLLYQDKTGGLEAFSPEQRQWISINPKENAILLNTGDLLEIMTSGHLPAALHRVSMPETKSKRQLTRQSIVFFVHFDHECWIEPNPELKPHPINQGKKYKRIQSFQHVQNRLTESHKPKNE